MLSLNRSSVYFVDGLSNASRGSSINYNIIDIAVDHILNGKRTALVAYTNSFKSGELHLRVALAVKLTCGAVLNAYFYTAVKSVEDSFNRSGVGATVKLGIGALNYKSLRSLVIRSRESDILFSLGLYGKTCHCDIALVLTYREANRVKVHILDNELFAEIIRKSLCYFHIDTAVTVAVCILKRFKSRVGGNYKLILGGVKSS